MNGLKSLVVFQSKSERFVIVPPLAWNRFTKLSATPLPKVSLSENTATLVSLSVLRM